jgi:hypothetical protein
MVFGRKIDATVEGRRIRTAAADQDDLHHQGVVRPSMATQIKPQECKLSIKLLSGV